MISIIDYGSGNINSIANMIKKAGGNAEIVSAPDGISKATKLILPGVGAFDHGMLELKSRSLIEEMRKAAFDRRIPILGICLGMQLLCNMSEEGAEPGLGWIDADIKKFASPVHNKVKVPHMGWNLAVSTKENPLIDSNSEEQRFYFVHSYHAVCKNPDNALAYTNHGCKFASAINRENIFGVQFHPEKSHRFGLKLFENFLRI